MKKRPKLIGIDIFKEIEIEPNTTIPLDLCFNQMPSLPADRQNSISETRTHKTAPHSSILPVDVGATMHAEITTEGEFTIPTDGEKLYMKTWHTGGIPKATVVFIHGFSDHCNAYGGFFPDLSSHGIEVRSFDQRGWGRSVKEPSERGLTGSTSIVLSDITAFINLQLPTCVPLFLMGHSMGGGEVLCFLANDSPAIVEAKKSIRGFLAQAPFICAAPSTVPLADTLASMAGKVAGKLLPHHQTVHSFDSTLFCRDPTVNQAFDDDELCHDTSTFEGLSGLIERGNLLHSGNARISPDAGEGSKTRIWFGHGDSDGLCDFNGTKTFYECLGNVADKELKRYPGCFHQLHAEPSPDKEIFLNDVVNWILARSGPLDT